MAITLLDNNDKQEILTYIDESCGEKTDFSKINQAYIKDGKITCNVGNNTSGKTARYIGVDMKYLPFSGKINFGFTDNTTADSTVLMILTKLGCQKSTDITHGAVHIGVSPLGVTIEYYDGSYTYRTADDETFVLNSEGVKIKDHNPKTLKTHTFATPLKANTTYSLSFQMVNKRHLQITFPDGAKYDWYSNSTDTRYDEIWDAFAGQYMIFEEFYPHDSNQRGYYVSWEAIAPEYMLDETDDSDNIIHKGYITAYREHVTAVQAYLANGTPIETDALQDWEDENELYILKHDFTKSLDGELTTAPSGQVYHLFNNDL